MERMIQICNILKKYCCDDYCPFFTDYDILGFCVDIESISKEDLYTLTEELNLHYDEDYCALVMFT